MGQLVHAPFPCHSHLVSDIPASSALMAQPLVVITGHCFYPTGPPGWQKRPSAFPPAPSSTVIAQFNTRTSEHINKTRQALPVFYMASERWIHAFVIMINAAVYYFYCSSGLNTTVLSYLSAVKIHREKMVSLSENTPDDTPDHRSTEDLEQLFFLGKKHQENLRSFKGEFQKFVRLYSRPTWAWLWWLQTWLLAPCAYVLLGRNHCIFCSSCDRTLVSAVLHKNVLC